MNDCILLDDINNRIKKEINYDILDELKDINLLNEYIKCISVKNKIKNFKDILDKYIDDDKIKQLIINDYLLDLIPAGTKGVIRGNKFNKIIKDFILNLMLDNDKFIIKFECKCDEHYISEIPDWYIKEKSTNKLLIGMNQLDLWNGGHQINRGFKYLEYNNNDNFKLLCVICNEIQITTTKNKTYKLFKLGFKNDTLCYINNLHNIILSYFNIIKN